MAKKKQTLDEKIFYLKQQQEEVKNHFFRLQGRIDELEDQKKENDEKAD